MIIYRYYLEEIHFFYVMVCHKFKNYPLFTIFIMFMINMS